VNRWTVTAIWLFIISGGLAIAVGWVLANRSEFNLSTPYGSYFTLGLAAAGVVTAFFLAIIGIGGTLTDILMKPTWYPPEERRRDRDER
jgi:hypothetical protein